jgi:tetratricopeptide (TPR) repeat protein/acyl carrier protein
MNVGNLCKPLGIRLATTSSDLAGDSLAGHYSEVADDSTQAAKKREAAMLITVAEKNLDSEEDPEAALQVAKEALAMCQAIGDDHVSADVLRLMVRAHIMQASHAAYEEGEGNSPTRTDALERAELLAEEEFEAFKRKGFKRGVAVMLLSWAEVIVARGKAADREQALTKAADALEAAHEIEDQKLEVLIFIFMVPLVVAMDQKDLAIQNASTARQLAKSDGNKIVEANALQAQAMASSSANSYAGFAEAIKYAKDAAGIFKESGLIKSQANVLLSIAAYYLSMEEPDKALSPARDAADLFQEAGKDKFGGPTAWALKVQAHIDMDQTKTAVAEAKEGHAQFAQAARGNRLVGKKQEIIALDTLAHAQLANNDTVEALNAVEAGLALCQDVNDRALEAFMLLTLCQVRVASEEWTEALAAGEDAFAIFTFLDDMEPQVAVAKYLVANIYCLVDQSEKGLKAVERARHVFKTCQDKRGEAFTWLMEASLRHGSGQSNEALEKADWAAWIFREQTDNVGEAVAQSLITEINMAKDKYSKAEVAARARKELLQQAGFRKAEMMAACTLSFVLNHVTDGSKEAGKVAREGFRLARAVEDKNMEVQMSVMVIISNIGLIGASGGPAAANKNIVDETTKLAKDSVALAKRAPDKGFEGPSLFWQAQVFAMMGSPEAITPANAALAVFRKEKFSSAEAQTLTLIAQLHYTQGEDERALLVAGEAVSIFSELKDMKGAAAAQAIIERIEEARGGMRGGMHMMQRMDIDATPVAAASALVVETTSKALDPMVVRAKLKDMVKDLISTDSVDVDTPLMDSGIDSLSSVQFRNDVAKEFNTTLPASLIFDYPNLGQLGQYLIENVAQ